MGSGPFTPTTGSVPATRSRYPPVDGLRRVVGRIWGRPGVSGLRLGFYTHHWCPVSLRRVVGDKRWSHPNNTSRKTSNFHRSPTPDIEATSRRCGVWQPNKVNRTREC